MATRPMRRSTRNSVDERSGFVAKRKDISPTSQLDWMVKKDNAWKPRSTPS
jgi:hypothetical protein